MKVSIRLRSFLAVTSISLLAISNASAATVLIDRSATDTVSNPAGDGKHWNSIGTTTITFTGFTSLAQYNISANGVAGGANGDRDNDGVDTLGGVRGALNITFTKLPMAAISPTNPLTIESL